MACLLALTTRPFASAFRLAPSRLTRRLDLTAVASLSTAAPLDGFFAVPGDVKSSLAERGIEELTPIQEAAAEPVWAGRSCALHAETGSGKTLAMFLPVLSRLLAADPAGGSATTETPKMLVLAPTRELALQHTVEAERLLAHTDHKVRLVTLGERTPAEALPGATVIVATPLELGQLMSETKTLYDWLPAAVGVLVLDELDVLIPSRKFTGRRWVRFQDDGMHPAEGLVKMVAKRTEREDLQVLAASATLSKATQRKLERVLRGSPLVKEHVLPLLTLRTERHQSAEVEQGLRQLWTLVPPQIKHRHVGLGPNGRTDPVRALRAAARSLLADSEDPGAGLVFVCSSSGLKVRAITKELRSLGFDAVGLTDWLWPQSTRSRKSRDGGRRRQVKAEAEGDAQGQAEPSTQERHAQLNAAAARGSDRDLPKLVVTDQAMTRGLHLDGIRYCFILGAPANMDTYLHLAGRTGRWPRVEGTVVTIAPHADIKKLRSWSTELGVSFGALDL